jgi:hypothetical protein
MPTLSNSTAASRSSAQPPDRDAQFRFIAKRVRSSIRRGEPAISIDTKKKETLGNLNNAGKTYRRGGESAHCAK